MRSVKHYWRHYSMQTQQKRLHGHGTVSYKYVPQWYNQEYGTYVEVSTHGFLSYPTLVEVWRVERYPT